MARVPIRCGAGSLDQPLGALRARTLHDNHENSMMERR
jgi:hypothetical protein